MANLVVIGGLVVGGAGAVMTLNELLAAKERFGDEAESLWNERTGQGDTGVDGEGDAFRHAYTSARFAQEYGRGTAYTLGTGWEYVGIMSPSDFFSNSSQAARNMDLHNNEVGRDIGS